jgi:hypothetical protein
MGTQQLAANGHRWHYSEYTNHALIAPNLSGLKNEQIKRKDRKEAKNAKAFLAFFSFNSLPLCPLALRVFDLLNGSFPKFLCLFVAPIF